MAKICKNIDGGGIEQFQNSFRAPGHVPILIASEGLMLERAGHTELCIYLAHLAGITSAVVMCEMLDPVAYNALSSEEAKKYAARNDIPFIESSQLKKIHIKQV
jgi:3,4-dihydroxy 2-butanone 4-phosphate synthase